MTGPADTPTPTGKALPHSANGSSTTLCSCFVYHTRHMVQPRSGCHRLPCYRLSLQLTTADVAVGFFAPCSAWLVVVVPLPTTLLLYPLSTTSDKCGCGWRHLCPLLSLVINLLSDWPTCSRHLANTGQLVHNPRWPDHLRLLSVRASHLLNSTTTVPTPIPIFASPFSSIVNSPATSP